MSEAKKITIRGIQKVEGDSVPTTLTVFGKHVEKDGIHYIFYEEYQEELRYKCRITYDASRQTLIQKKNCGGVEDVLTFQKGKAHPCSYHTPMGLWELRSETTEIRHDVDEEGLAIFLSYRLYAGEQTMGDYELKIEV